MEIKTAGELRGFLAGILTDIQRGEITVDKANAIAKVSAQINQSLAVEVTAALKLQKLDEAYPCAGGMLIGPSRLVEQPLDQGGGIWCDQCEARVTIEEAAGCKSRFCKAKVRAVA